MYVCTINAIRRTMKEEHKEKKEEGRGGQFRNSNGILLQWSRLMTCEYRKQVTF